MSQPLLSFNPFRPDFIEDPYPVFARMREDGPVHWCSLGIWYVIGYAEATTILRDTRFSNDMREWDRYGSRFRLDTEDHSRSLIRAWFKWLLFVDPPEHTRLKGCVSKLFSNGFVDRMRAEAQRIVDDLLDAAERSGEIDVVGDLAYPLPRTMIADLLAIPEEDRERVQAWSDCIMPAFDPLMPMDVFRRADAAVLEFTDYLRRGMERNRAAGSSDFLSELSRVGSQDGLDDDDVASIGILLYVAGHETTVGLISNGLLALSRKPDQLARLREDPSLVPRAVEEMLRYESPIQTVIRFATVDTEVGGVEIRKGQQVSVSLAAANRDPARFADPERFDVGRRENPHLAFSYGPHYCSGAGLARLQGATLLASLVRRFPDFRCQTEKVEWERSFIRRRPRRLGMTL